MVNIKRKISLFVLVLMLSMVLLNPITAKAEGARVFDDANLFTGDEIIKLDSEANILSNTYDMDIIIVTTDDAEGKTAEEYADDYFDYNGFGVGDDLDGILFLIDMDNRETRISTSGIGIKYLTDKRVANIVQRVLDGGLSDGNYYNATNAFLSGTKQYLEEGIPSNQNPKAKEKNTLSFMDTIIGFFSGLGASAAFFFRTKSKYKMKNPSKPLTFRDNSIISLTLEEDKLVDTILTNRIIPKSSNNDSGTSTTHTSSSGNTHGGGGSKF